MHLHSSSGSQKQSEAKQFSGSGELSLFAISSSCSPRGNPDPVTVVFTMSLRMNPTPLAAIKYDSGGGSSSSSIMTSDDVDAGLAHDEATLSDPQPAANAAREDDDAVMVAQVREEPQCEITVVESDHRPHNTAHAVLQQQSADLQVRTASSVLHPQVLVKFLCSSPLLVLRYLFLLYPDLHVDNS